MSAAKVSVVIPVYNTAQYLDCCLESAVRQTYGALEIILVDDGSTDGSRQRCGEWEKRDSRIRAFSVPHAGAGAARNFGMDRCTGEYLMFLDSDDWWDADLAERAVAALECEPDVDFAWFDLTVHWPERVMTAKRPALLAAPCSVKDNPLMLTAAGASPCDKIYKMSFLRNIDFTFPALLNEDIIVHPWIFLGAKKIFQCKCLGYHYRRAVPTSTSFGNAHGIEEKDVVSEAFQLLRRQKMSDGHTEILSQWCFFQYKFMENAGKYHLTAGTISAEHYSAFFHKVSGNLDEFHPGWRLVEENGFLVFGSYSLRSVISYALLDLRRIRHYQCSSLAAAFSPRRQCLPPLEHPSPYRAAMLEHERAGDCAARLADRGREADFFCLDLLEDRFPLLDCGPAGLVTKSDALDESLAASRLPLLGRVLERGREETETRWREGCLSAIARIRERFAPGRIILVKTFLADAYGEYGPERAFADAARIRESNAHLERCYAFFAEHCPGIRVVTVPERLRFSDASFKHGCAPWHLNDFCYYALAGEVRDHIMRVKQEASCAAKASSRGSAQ